MMKITKFGCFLILLAFSNAFQLKALAGEDVSEDLVNPIVVKEKIQLLGLRDDNVPFDERPHNWLKNRIRRVLPELIAGLDNPEKRIADGCLEVMTGITESKDFYDALVRIAADESHPINNEAIIFLCTFPPDERAKEILQKALLETQRFEDPRDRATIALALGLKSQAVELLVEYIIKSDTSYEKDKAIKWLGDIGHDSAIPFLEEAAETPEWHLVVEAYLAMAKIDPVEHGLTEVQQTFLIDSRRRGKLTKQAKFESWQELAKYDKKETRPFVMQMLRSDSADTSAVVLQTWKDKEALPEIKQVIQEEAFVRSWHFQMLLAAYLDIEGTERSTQEAASLLKDVQEKQQSRQVTDKVKFSVMAIVESPMSRERKIEILRGIKTAIGPLAVAQSLVNLPISDESASIVLSLMQGEKEIAPLGAYARSAMFQKKETFRPEIYRALQILVSQDSLSPEQFAAAQSILDASIAYELESAGKQVDKILRSNWSISVKLSAAAVCTKLGGDRAKGLTVLYDALKDEDPAVRAQTVGYLMNIACQGEDERLEREDSVLSCLDLPCEDYALRLLTTCGGQKSIEMLERLLNQENVSRAVYAAWVLAQNKKDEEARQKGLRRVAIYALFNHQVYQQGSGIDFNIAAGLNFHQTTSRLNPQAYPIDNLPVTIPRELLIPFTWDENEQVFAICTYRSRLWNRHYHTNPVGFLETYAFPNRPIEELDETLLPLLRVIANEDPMLRIKFKQGNPIASFPNRQAAAKVIAKITADKTTYPGLKGELLDSEEIPEQPYDRQNQRIAEFVLKQVQSARFVMEPNSQKDWDRMETFRYWINDLIRSVGPELKEALFTEAQRRDIAEGLEKARFSIWTKQD